MGHHESARITDPPNRTFWLI